MSLAKILCTFGAKIASSTPGTALVEVLLSRSRKLLIQPKGLVRPTCPVEQGKVTSREEVRFGICAICSTFSTLEAYVMWVVWRWVSYILLP